MDAQLHTAQTAARFDGRWGPDVSCTLKVQAYLHATFAQYHANGLQVHKMLNNTTTGKPKASAM